MAIRKIAAVLLGLLLCTPALAVQKTWWVPRGSEGVALSGVNLVATTGVVVTDAAFGDSGLTIIVKDGNSLNSVSYSTTNLHDLTSATACLQDDNAVYTTDTTDC